MKMNRVQYLIFFLLTLFLAMTSACKSTDFTQSQKSKPKTVIPPKTQEPTQYPDNPIPTGIPSTGTNPNNIPQDCRQYLLMTSQVQIPAHCVTALQPFVNPNFNGSPVIPNIGSIPTTCYNYLVPNYQGQIPVQCQNFITPNFSGFPYLFNGSPILPGLYPGLFPNYPGYNQPGIGNDPCNDPCGSPCHDPCVNPCDPCDPCAPIGGGLFGGGILKRFFGAGGC